MPYDNLVYDHVTAFQMPSSQSEIRATAGSTTTRYAGSAHIVDGNLSAESLTSKLE